PTGTRWRPAPASVFRAAALPRSSQRPDSSCCMRTGGGRRLAAPIRPCGSHAFRDLLIPMLHRTDAKRDRQGSEVFQRIFRRRHERRQWLFAEHPRKDAIDLSEMVIEVEASFQFLTGKLA